jgi:hypothetical protein
MRTTIKTRSDRGTLSFWANDKRGAYVYLEDKGAGTTGSQICEGGGFRGNTITCDGTPEGLARVARQWWRQTRQPNF